MILVDDHNTKHGGKTKTIAVDDCAHLSFTEFNREPFSVFVGEQRYESETVMQQSQTLLKCRGCRAEEQQPDHRADEESR